MADFADAVDQAFADTSDYHAPGRPLASPTASSVLSLNLPPTQGADSNPHPVIPDQALNLLSKVSYAYRPRQNVLCVPRSGRMGRI